MTATNPQVAEGVAEPKRAAGSFLVLQFLPLLGVLVGLTYDSWWYPLSHAQRATVLGCGVLVALLLSTQANVSRPEGLLLRNVLRGISTAGVTGMFAILAVDVAHFDGDARMAIVVLPSLLYASLLWSRGGGAIQHVEVFVLSAVLALWIMHAGIALAWTETLQLLPFGLWLFSVLWMCMARYLLVRERAVGLCVGVTAACFAGSLPLYSKPVAAFALCCIAVASFAFLCLSSRREPFPVSVAAFSIVTSLLLGWGWGEVFYQY